MANPIVRKCSYYSMQEYAERERNPKFSLRYPENVSVHRVKGFNKESVYHMFDLLTAVVEDNKPNGLRTFSVDEIRFQIVQKKAPKVLAEKRKASDWKDAQCCRKSYSSEVEAQFFSFFMTKMSVFESMLVV
ncbi:hypothetical protein J437_LFUL012123 [Ladona fulva]|uniref:Uncharacterized protein n=1 Tax=Ladona fulva TaxID=123851 RepID=A0A8K0KE89_LADFU|nr:hypothetical protein J437_LFUL012123 [Ladona fulva]